MNRELSAIRQVFHYALPICASFLTNFIASFFAILFLGRLGKIQLAAASLAIPTFLCVMTLCATVFFAVSIVVSHQHQSKKADTEIGKILLDSSVLALIISIPAMLLMWNGDELLLLMRQKPELIAIATPYLHLAALSMVPNLFGSAVSQFHIGIGRPKFPFYNGLLRIIPTIALSYAFTLGKWGCPQLGLAGVMLGTVIPLYANLFGIILYLYFAKSLSSYDFFNRKYSVNWSQCWKIFKLGFPIGLQFGGELSAMAFANYMLGWFGVSALAAMQVISQYNKLLIMITLGISQAISVLVSRAHADDNYLLANKYINAGASLIGIEFILVVIGFSLFYNPMIKLFLPHKSLTSITYHYAKLFLFISAIILVLDGLRNVYIGALRGFKDAKTPMKIGVGCLWFISIPLCYVIGFTMHGGPIALRAAYGIGFLVAVTLLMYRLNTRIKIHKNHLRKITEGV